MVAAGKGLGPSQPFSPVTKLVDVIMLLRLHTYYLGANLARLRL